MTKKITNPNQKRISELEKEILYHKKKYYIDDKPEISDDEFDLKCAELRLLDPMNRVLNLTGSDIKDKKTWSSKKLTEQMGSLDKVNSLKEYYEWESKFKDKEKVYNPKGDGGSIELTYKKGNLVSAITRGDGYEGEDITPNVLKMKNVKQHINTTADVAVLKGEVIIYYKDFLELNIKENGRYKNPRNTATGQGKSKDGENCHYLTVLYWGASIRGKTVNPAELDKVCKYYGLKTIGVYQTKHIEEYYNKIGSDPDKREEKMRDLYGFDIDGFVIKCNEEPIMRGNVPVNYIALKFPAQSGVTKISEIILEKGKSGQITPVAKFDPSVNLMGATITKASLGSWDIMQKKGLFPGAIVEVIRANDVIPKIVAVRTPALQPFTFADAQKMMKDSNLIIKGAHLFTSTRDTQMVGFEILNIFKTLEFMNVAESTIESIVKHFDLKHAYEIFDVHFEQMKNVDGFGTRTIENLKQQIRDKSKVSFKIFVDCLNVNNLGTSRIVEVVNTFNLRSVQDLYKLKEQDFLKVNAFSDVLAKSVYDGLQAKKDFAFELAKRLIIDENVGKPLSNKLISNNQPIKFCITGKTSSKRSEMEKLIEANGGKNSSIGSCDYLINNDSDSSSSKNKKAKECGIPIINERTFFDEIMTGKMVVQLRSKK